MLHYGGAVVRWVSTPQQIELIKKILKDKYGEESETYKKMKDCIAEAKIALDSRNEYIHSVYFINPEDNFRIKPGRGKFSIPKLDIDLNMMQASLVQATVAMDKLNQTARDLDLPFPLPGTQPPQSPNQEDTQDQTQKGRPDQPQSSEE